jgi:hypothetical protein
VDLNGKALAADLLCDGAMPGAIVLRHVLEHLSEPSQVLSLCCAARVPHVPIIVPNGGATLARWLGEYWSHWDPPRHLLFFTAASLGRLVRRCGDRVVAQRTDGMDEIVTSAVRGR